MLRYYFISIIMLLTLFSTSFSQRIALQPPLGLTWELKIEEAKVLLESKGFEIRSPFTSDQRYFLCSRSNFKYGEEEIDKISVYPNDSDQVERIAYVLCVAKDDESLQYETMMRIKANTDEMYESASILYKSIDNSEERNADGLCFTYASNTTQLHVTKSNNSSGYRIYIIFSRTSEEIKERIRKEWKQ